MENINKIIIGLLIFLSFMVGTAYQDILVNGKSLLSDDNPPITEKDILNSCSNLNLTESANCLTNQVKTFYNYTLTDDKKTLTFNELKTFGGDCKDWSELYERLGIELGFYTQFIKIDVETEVLQYGGNIRMLHDIVIMSDETGYCLMDATSNYCGAYAT